MSGERRINEYQKNMCKMNARHISEDMLLAFKSFLISGEKEKLTVEKYMRDIKKFREFAGEREIEKSVILKYKEEIGKSYAVSSANSMIASVNSFMRFAGWEELCVKQFRMQKQMFCRANRELSREEYIRLITAAKSKGNERLNLILQTICATGIRVSELRFVTVEAVKKGEAAVQMKSKTRVIFFVRKLRAMILEYAARKKIESGCIFVTKSGKVINRTEVWRDMKGLCRQAGVAEEKVYPHNLRHLFARTFYKIEKDIAKLADILGHSSINTTRIYIVTTVEEHKKKMEEMRLII